MYWIVQDDVEWRLLEDRSGQEFVEAAGRMVFRTAEFHQLASGPAADVLLVAAGMGITSYGSAASFSIATREVWSDLLRKRRGEITQNALDYPQLETEDVHG